MLNIDIKFMFTNIFQDELLILVNHFSIVTSMIADIEYNFYHITRKPFDRLKQFFLYIS